MGNIITTLSGRSAPLTTPPTPSTPTTPPAPTGQKRKRHPSEPPTPTESRPKKRPRLPNFRLLPHDTIPTFTTKRCPARNPRTLTLTLLPREAPRLHRNPVNPRHYWAPRDPVPPKPYLLENVENPSPVESECSPAGLVREVMERATATIMSPIPRSRKRAAVVDMNTSQEQHRSPKRARYPSLNTTAFLDTSIRSYRQHQQIVSQQRLPATQSSSNELPRTAHVEIPSSPWPTYMLDNDTSRTAHAGTPLSPRPTYMLNTIIETIEKAAERNLNTASDNGPVETSSQASIPSDQPDVSGASINSPKKAKPASPTPLRTTQPSVAANTFDPTYAEDVERAAGQKVQELRAMLQALAKHISNLEARNREAEAKVKVLEAAILEARVEAGMRAEKMKVAAELLGG